MICPSFRKRSLLPLATLFAIAQAASTALAQSETPSDYLQINAESVQTFNDGTAQIIVVSKPLTIETDGTKLSADSAVIWITPQPGALSRQRAEIALIGNATLVQPTNSRTGDRLFVSTVVGGSLRLCVQSRDNSDPRQLPLYKTAADIRPMILAAAERQDNLSIQRPWIDDTSTQPATMPTTLPSPNSPVTFSASDVQTTTNTPDGKIAAILRGKVLLMQRRPNGDLIELQAQECVLFTNLTNFTQMQNGSGDMSGAVVAAYMEGDVRINVTPATKPGGHALGEQRMRADRVYYEFATDRAIMTHVVLQTGDPRLPFPITMRANVAKQLAMGEYDTQKTVLTTSQFLDPSYSINSDKVYIRQYNLDDGYGPRTAYQADDATFKIMNTPVFYMPTATGEFSQEGEAVRKLELGSGRGSGFGFETQWGLFQSAGLLPPPGIDADYEIDYFSDRGPGFGFDTSYKGGELAQTTKDGWNFSGDFTSYILPQDSGTDKLGHERVSIPHDDDTRGAIQWEHQQILPDDWELQVRAGYASDPTFLEEWYEKQFNDGDPTNLSLYLKHQKDTEAVTFLMEYQPNGFVTNADSLQNRFEGNRGDPATDGALGSLNDRPFEVDRLPEIGYFRIGDAVADDKMTFFSENRAGGYRMNEGDAILGTVGDDPTHGIINNFDNSYGFEANGTRDRFSTPGIPSLGYTGTSEDYVLRADSRQEIDYPIDAGQFKVVPYVMGRYTGYSDSPDGDPQNRVIAGTGLRMTTAFWKTDDQAESDFFDIHRVRHVIEPELNLFTSGSSVDRNDLYIYDDTIDGVTDVSAASFWIRQRWETKRGGPGLWRSTDFFTFDVGITGFANSPTDPLNPDRQYIDEAGPSNDFYPERNRFGPQSASAFRGLFFESEPEASVPRSNIAAQSTWRISDTTIMLGDANWNIQHQELATAAVGLLVGRGDRVTYYAGLRYIGELDSTVASFSSTYQLSAKYTINFAAAVDLASTSSKGGSFSIIRKFDRFYMGIGAYYDAVENQSGFTVSLYPEGAVGGVNTGQLQKLQQ